MHVLLSQAYLWPAGRKDLTDPAHPPKRAAHPSPGLGRKIMQEQTLLTASYSSIAFSILAFALSFILLIKLLNSSWNPSMYAASELLILKNIRRVSG